MRTGLVVALALLIPLGLAACGGDTVEPTTEPDTDHTGPEEPKAGEPKSEHPKGDEKKDEHPKSEHPK